MEKKKRKTNEQNNYYIALLKGSEPKVGKDMLACSFVI